MEKKLTSFNWKQKRHFDSQHKRIGKHDGLDSSMDRFFTFPCRIPMLRTCLHHSEDALNLIEAVKFLQAFYRIACRWIKEAWELGQRHKYCQALCHVALGLPQDLTWGAPLQAEVHCSNYMSQTCLGNKPLTIDKKESWRSKGSS